MIGDFQQYSHLKRQELLREADLERLAAQVPQPPSALRHTLAQVCHRVANWIDHPQQYVRLSDSGPVDWAGRWVNL